MILILKKSVFNAKYFEVPRCFELKWESLEQLLPEEIRGGYVWTRAVATDSTGGL
jgi:hypothetical protein